VVLIGAGEAWQGDDVGSDAERTRPEAQPRCQADPQRPDSPLAWAEVSAELVSTLRPMNP